MTRALILTLALLVLTGPSARAQFNFVGPGSTAEGDYLRGVGVAAFGMGVYNQQTAVANSINADTAMRVNEYIYSALMNENRMNAEHRVAQFQRAKDLYAKYRDRIINTPEAKDVDKGDALNALLEQLNSPNISESALKYEAVPLSVEDVRCIPFKLSEKGARFSMSRLTAKARSKWPVAFQDKAFDPEREGYRRALDTVLDQQYRGAVQNEAIEALKTSVDRLDDKLRRHLGESTDRLYTEARDRLKEMKATIDMLKAHKIETALGELDRYAGTSVNDLRVFMRSHGLQFADASSPEEKRLYPELYVKLKQQHDKVAVGIGVPDPEPRK